MRSAWRRSANGSPRTAPTRPARPMCPAPARPPRPTKFSIASSSSSRRGRGPLRSGARPRCRAPSGRSRCRMKDLSVKALLLSTIAVMTAIPLIASFYFLDDALQRSLNLGFNPQVVQALDIASQNLKTLKTADPANEARYREEFARIGDLRHVYSQPDVLKRAILDSLKTYFGVGLVGALLASVAVALLLSRRISNSYQATFDELLRHRDRVRYLEQMASWQELARILAHEIKNPLTPIEVLVTSLARAHADKSHADFGELLKQTQSMVREEIGHLKQTVRNFGDFAKLPSVQLETLVPAALIGEQLSALSASFESAQLELDASDCPPALRARMDPLLFRQVLMNIIA